MPADFLSWDECTHSYFRLCDAGKLLIVNLPDSYSLTACKLKRAGFFVCLFVFVFFLFLCVSIVSVSVVEIVTLSSPFSFKDRRPRSWCPY